MTIAQRTANNDDTKCESETGTDAGDVDRRGFLKLLGLSGAGLGIGVLSSSPAAAATKITPSEVVTDQTRSDSLILNSLTTDPDPVEQGQLFYWSDMDEIRYSPDGTATKQIGGGADWSEVTNKPTLPEGVSSAVILRIQLADAEQRFAAALAQRNYDDMFVDPYVDQSRIASTNNVEVNDGQNGSVQLSGSESASETSTNNSSNDINPIRGIIPNIDIYVTQVGFELNEDVSELKVRVESAGGTVVYEENHGSYSADEWNTVSLNVGDYSGVMEPETDYDIYITDQSETAHAYLEGISRSNDLFDIDSTISSHNSSSGGTSVVAESASKETSGTVTSEAKDLGYSPDKMQVIDTADVPSGTDLSYTIRDENSNTVDVPRSSLESDVDTSALTGTEIELLSNFSSDGSDTPTQ